MRGMESMRRQDPQAALLWLETAAASARGGFACMFSTADEFESALISQRRAQGRYITQRGRWPLLLVGGLALMATGMLLLLG